MPIERVDQQYKVSKLTSKNDSYGAQCVARVAINELNNLPNAMPEVMYWTLSQLVNRRANLKVYHIGLKNQLHEQVCIAYPSYKQFFQDIGRPTALYFWEHYPLPRLLQNKTVEKVALIGYSRKY